MKARKPKDMNSLLMRLANSSFRLAPDKVWFLRLSGDVCSQNVLVQAHV